MYTSVKDVRKFQPGSSLLYFPAVIKSVATECIKFCSGIHILRAMVHQHFVQWIQSPQSTNTGNNISPCPEQQKASVMSNDRPVRLHQGLLVLLVLLCCLLLIACVVLGVLYNKELKDSNSPELDILLSEFRNLSSEYQRASGVNRQLQQENTNLTQHNIMLQSQNGHLNRSNTELNGQKNNLTQENFQLHHEIWNLTIINGELDEKVSLLMQNNTLKENENRNISYSVAQLLQQNMNLTDSYRLLQIENYDLSKVVDLLRVEVKGATDNNTWLQEENQKLSDQNNWLQEENMNLTQENLWLKGDILQCSDIKNLLTSQYDFVKEKNTELQINNMGLLNQNIMLQHQKNNLILQNTWLQEERLNLSISNTRLYSEIQNLTDQNNALSQEYFSLDQYCPVVEQETQERLCKKCKDNWTLFRSKCYFFSISTMTWNESRSQCQSEGADLMIINSDREQRFASDMIQSVYQSHNNIWIGLSDLGKEGEWHWVDGSPVTEDLQYWLPRDGSQGEPDDWKVVNPVGEDCGHLTTPSNDFSINIWMDGSCDIAYNWICESSFSV